RHRAGDRRGAPAAAVRPGPHARRAQAPRRHGTRDPLGARHRPGPRRDARREQPARRGGHARAGAPGAPAAAAAATAPAPPARTPVASRPAASPARRAPSPPRKPSARPPSRSRRPVRPRSEPAMARILIAEDEPLIVSFVEKGLRSNGFVTLAVDDGAT